MSVIEEIAAERRRQVEAEGWTPEHDDRHACGEMARAAATYAYVATLDSESRRYTKVSMWAGLGDAICRNMWPWNSNWFKPTDPRRDLIKAGALIVAEIERRDRAAAKASTPSCPCDPNHPLQNTCEHLACWSKEG